MYLVSFQPFASWAVGDMCLAPNPQTGFYEEAVLTSVESDSCILTFIQSNTKEKVNMASLRPRDSKQKASEYNLDYHLILVCLSKSVHPDLLS